MEPYPDLTSGVLKHNTLIRKLLRDSNITERQLAFHDQRFDDIATLLDRLRIDCGVVEPTREHAHVQEALGECSHTIIPETANDVTSDNSSCARVLAPVIAALDTVDKLFGHVCPKIENVQQQTENIRKKVDTAQSSQECRDFRLLSLQDENTRLANRVEVDIGQIENHVKPARMPSFRLSYWRQSATGIMQLQSHTMSSANANKSGPNCSQRRES